MSDNSKFTKREWIHLIITISIIEGFIFWVSFQFSGNSSALGYVSFAGTLISIILAVLAIGYTYGESHQQKNSSTTLANQIESLVEIKDKLEIQADAMMDIQSVKNHIIDISEKLDNSFKETNGNITSVKDLYASIKDPYIMEQNNDGPNGLEGIDRKVLLRNLIGEMPTRFTKLVIVVSLLFFEKRDVYKGKGFLALKNFFEDNDINIGGEGMYNRVFGATVQLALILNRCDYLSAKSGFVDPQLLDQFNDIVNNDLDELERAFNLTSSSILNFAKTSEYYKKS